MKIKKGLFSPSKGSLVAIAATLIIAPASTKASVTVIDFEGFSNGTLITNQFAGLVLSNTYVAKAGQSLNVSQYPAFSGDNAVLMFPADPLSVDFSTPMSNVGAYFTYNRPVTLSFYGAGNVLLGTVLSTYEDNTVSSGNSPNEYMQFSFPAGITRMEAAVGSFPPIPDPFDPPLEMPGTFVLDNLTFTAASPVPEPASAMINLILGGTGIGMTLRRRRR